MLKVIAAIALLGSVSTIAIVPASNSSLGSRPAFKVDGLETRANAAARNYMSPRLAGEPVVFCLSGGSQCGKPAADAFCRSNGSEKAVTFQRDSLQSDPAKLPSARSSAGARRWLRSRTSSSSPPAYRLRATRRQKRTS